MIDEKHEDWLICLRLSKAGLGIPEQIAEWDARKMIQALTYIKFLEDWESTYIELNKEDS